MEGAAQRAVLARLVPVTDGPGRGDPVRAALRVLELKKLESGLNQETFGHRRRERAEVGPHVADRIEPRQAAPHEPNNVHPRRTRWQKE